MKKVKMKTLYVRGVKEVNAKYLQKKAAMNAQTLGQYINVILDNDRKQEKKEKVLAKS